MDILFLCSLFSFWHLTDSSYNYIFFINNYRCGIHQLSFFSYLINIVFAESQLILMWHNPVSSVNVVFIKDFILKYFWFITKERRKEGVILKILMIRNNIEQIKKKFRVPLIVRCERLFSKLKFVSFKKFENFFMFCHKK